MEWFMLFTVIIYKIGVTFGVGASTFALLFYINALKDGIIDASESRFMHLVFIVLRIGMALITFSLSSFAVLWAIQGNIIMALQPLYLMEVTLMAVIIVNAILMTKHLMPMKFGPVLAGGSWYSIFLVTTLPLVGFSYAMLFYFYLFFLALFFVVFSLIKARYVD